MTAPSQVIPGATYLLSRRCTERQFLLTPDDHVVQTYEYCLGIAAKRFNITLLAWCTMSNHHHVVMVDHDGNRPRFLHYLDALCSRALNAHRERVGNLFAAETPSAVRLVEPDDVLDKIAYTLANPVTADLVDRVADHPGASSYGLNLSGRSKTVQRPRGYFRAKGPTLPAVELTVARPEGFGHLSQEEWVGLVQDAVRAREDEARASRLANGRRVVGRKAVLRTTPTDRPSTPMVRSTLHPRIACKDPARRGSELAALRFFRNAYKRAREAFVAGLRDTVFPFGTYMIRVALGAKCEPTRQPVA